MMMILLHGQRVFLLALCFLLLPLTAEASQVFDERIKEAARLLKDAGINDLCLPTSNHLAPLFPRCGAAINVIEESRRRLSDEGGFDYQPEELVDPREQSLNRPACKTTTNPDVDGTGRSQDFSFYLRNGLFAFVCVATAAIAAGLTLGLLSLDPLSLLVKMRTADSDTEKKEAASLLPIVRQHHLLLVTLLLLNSLANEALPLFLDKIVPSYVAIILSVTLVLFFGEIIPSAVFTGPARIRIASRLTPLVRLVMCLFYPIAFPIAKLLDVLLHDEEDDTAFSRGELSALVRIQYEERMASKNQRRNERVAAKRYLSEIAETHPFGDYKSLDCSLPGSTERLIKREMSRRSSGHERSHSLHFDEVNMIEGALHMKTKMALNVYTPLRQVFSVPYDCILSEKRVVEIYSSGYSRVPVYVERDGKEMDKTGIIGILLTKQLIVVNTSDKRPLTTLPLQNPYCVSPTISLVDLINLFQTPAKGNKGGHLALVCARPVLAQQALDRGQPLPEEAGLMGLVTLEDCLEELLQEEVFDEYDRAEIKRMRKAKWAWRKWRIFVKRQKLKREEDELNDSREPGMLNIVKQAQMMHAAECGEASPLVDTLVAKSSVLGNRNRDDSRAKPFFGLF